LLDAGVGVEFGLADEGQPAVQAGFGQECLGLVGLLVQQHVRLPRRLAERSAANGHGSMGDPTKIPAATVQDVDLSDADPALAAEVRRLGDLIELGRETPDEFARLVRLLVEASQRAKAEYLLRRNYEVAVGGLGLYRELFGTGKADEFAAAVEAFGTQFGVRLEFIASRHFLEGDYRVNPGPPRADEFALLGEPCEGAIRFRGPGLRGGGRYE
jgi:hypothetical protein